MLDETKNKNIDIKSIQSCSAGVDSYQIPSLPQPNVVSVAHGRDEDNRKSFCLLSWLHNKISPFILLHNSYKLARGNEMILFVIYYLYTNGL